MNSSPIRVNVTFACSLNGSAPVPCASPLVLSGLGGGSYTFSVVATNEHGQVEVDPIEWSWSVDAPADVTPPDTEVLTGPPAVTTAPTATFTFISTELGSTFLCGLVPLGPLEVISSSSCQNPELFQDLVGGNHEFQVAAVDLAGNIDPTPASLLLDGGRRAADHDHFRAKAGLRYHRRAGTDRVD